MYGSVVYTPSLLADSGSSSVVSTRRSASEAVPLLTRLNEGTRQRKPFYRARPLWLVPFVFVSSIAQSMTLAPRIEIYTQISCNHLQQTRPNPIQHAHPTASISSTRPSSSSTVLIAVNPSTMSFVPSEIIIDHDSVPTVVPEVLNGTRRLDAMRIPSSRCVSDPAVQAGAARLQMIMATTTGLFSALTSTWWGSFSERYGRTKVLAISTFGLLLTDLTFILISIPSLPFFRHGYTFSIMASIIEGLLGSFSSIQAATSSYIGDCTSSGSRAILFSRFTGAFYIGSATGPIIAGFFIHHPIVVFGRRFPFSSSMVDTSVFWVAIACSAINLYMALFVVPESLGNKKRGKAIQEYNKMGGSSKRKAKKPLHPPIDGVVSEISRIEGQEIEEVRMAGVTKNTTNSTGSTAGFIMGLLSPLSILLPVVVVNPSGIVRKRRDWSLTLLAVGLFGYMLSTGILHMNAIHTYRWSSRQLSQYISVTGGMRAFVLLLLLPTVIEVLKPKQPTISSKPFATGKGKKTTQIIIQPAPELTVMKGKKSKPNRSQLGREISFDLALTKCSLIIDIVSRSLSAIVPIPTTTVQLKHRHPLIPNTQSQAALVVTSALNCLGAGSVPLIHSLALSLMELRALDAKSSGIGVKENRTGELFGALAALQTVGQTILAPMLFGMIYSDAVAQFPKAIFVLGTLLCFFALSMISGMRNPAIKGFLRHKQSVIIKKRKVDPELERGRSRISKDLRGGAIAYYPRSSYSAVDNIKDGSESV